MRASGLADDLHVDSWRKLADLAARRAHAPNAMVTVVDADRQVLVSRAGLVRAAKRNYPLTHSLCRHVIERDAPLIVGDTRADLELQNEPAVAQLGVVAYAGFPIHAIGGHVIGALCVTDTHPRTWSPAVTAALAELAVAAEREVSLRLRRRLGRLSESDPERSWTPTDYMLLVVRPDGAITVRELAASRTPALDLVN